MMEPYSRQQFMAAYPKVHNQTLQPLDMNGEFVSDSELKALKFALIYLATQQVPNAKSFDEDQKTYVDNRKEWVAIAHNLKRLAKAGYRLFISFSELSKKYCERDADRVWKSIKQPNVSYKDVFRKAQALGWDSSEYLTLDDDFKTVNSHVDESNPLSWLSDFEVSEEAMEKISNPFWLFMNLIIQGHVIAIAAEPNGGKTTIFLYLAGVIAELGLKVIYVNADTSGGDAKPMHALAKEKDFVLLLPDMAEGGQSMEGVVNRLEEMSRIDADYSNVVFICDTLKKMVDVINKSRAKQLYKILRSLSSKGMTIILLCHTNKYGDENGRPIFEGTGDLRSDVDELIYLIPESRSDGTKVVTTDPDKVRGTFEPISFLIDCDRKVSLMNETVDTAAHRNMLVKVKKDKVAIDSIDNAIAKGHTNQTEILSHCCKCDDIKNHTVRRVLKDYSEASAAGESRSASQGLLWSRDSSGVNNELTYTTLETAEDLKLKEGFNDVSSKL